MPRRRKRPQHDDRQPELGVDQRDTSAHRSTEPSSSQPVQEADTSSSRPRKAAFGNFSNYYAIRRDVTRGRDINFRGDTSNGWSGGGSLDAVDLRIGAISTWIRSHRLMEGLSIRPIKRVLDVGCNSGEATLELAQFLGNSLETVIGVDVDFMLVGRAREMAAKKTFLRQETQGRQETALGIGRVGYEVGYPRKRLQLDEQLSEPSTSPNDVSKVRAIFHQCDWVHSDSSTESRSGGDGIAMSEEDNRGYDLITALSVTKWIHTAHYDDGLRRFFARVCQTLRPLGLFILEPQPYKSYKNLYKATAPGSQERHNFKALRVMPDDFAWILTEELGLVGPLTIRQQGKEGFMRSIEAYLQPPQDSLHMHCAARRAALLSRQPVDNPLLPEHLDTIPWVPRDH